MSEEHIPFHFKDWEDRDQGVHAQEQRRMYIDVTREFISLSFWGIR